MYLITKGSIVDSVNIKTPNHTPKLGVKLGIIWLNT